MIFGTMMTRTGDCGGLATRMWSQCSQRASAELPVDLPSAPISIPAMPIDLPPACVGGGPVRLPGPTMPEGISVIL